MQLTKEQAIQEHRKMWNWIENQYEKRTDLLKITENVEDLKAFYIDAVFSDEMIEGDCFCCEYDKKFGGLCDYCPIEWDSIRSMNMCLYKDYDNENLYGEICNIEHDECLDCDFSHCADLARQIANLPERKC